MEQRHIAANGIPVYSYSLPHLHSFCIGLYVKAGVLYEQPGQFGITHFLEHVLFRNLGGLSQRELYEKLEGMGASFNACTYKEFVYFYITATARHFRECAGIITMLLQPLRASKGDVAAERRRIQSEIREKDDLHSVERFARQEIWKGTPLTNQIAGSVTGVSAIGLGDLAAEKERSFVARNMFFYVSGSYTGGDLAALIDAAGQYEVDGERNGRGNMAPVPEGFGNRGGAVLFKGGSGYADVLFSFDVEFSRYTLAETNLLYDLIFGGNLCRFNMQLSENRGLIYDYDAYLEQYCNIGTLYVEFSVLQSRLCEALALTVGLFRSMRQQITAGELTHFLPEYTDNCLMALDNPQRLNWDMAYNNHILMKGYTSVEDEPALYRQVTPERLMEIAGEVFVPRNLVAAVKCKRSRGREEKVREIIDSL